MRRNALLEGRGVTYSVKEIFYTLNQEKLANNCCQVAGKFAPDIEVQIRE